MVQKDGQRTMIIAERKWLLVRAGCHTCETLKKKYGCLNKSCMTTVLVNRQAGMKYQRVLHLDEEQKLLTAVLTLVNGKISFFSGTNL